MRKINKFPNGDQPNNGQYFNNKDAERKRKQTSGIHFNLVGKIIINLLTSGNIKIIVVKKLWILL